MKNYTSLWFIIIIITFLAISPINVFAVSDADIIPPEILKQMDPDILSGERPTIYTLRQAEIFSLRESPKFDTDFVTFGFNSGSLSTIQRNILDNWIKSGTNKIYLGNGNIHKSGGLFQNIRVRKGHYGGSSSLLKHPVNTGFKKINIPDNYDCRGSCSIATITNLPLKSIVLANLWDGAAAGRFTIGDTHVYFKNSARGPDARRWTLNYWHWALGLKVPGSAETGIPAGSSMTLSEAKKYDTIELRNGDTITGHIMNEKFSIQTSYALLSFKLEKLQRIQIEGGGTNQDVLTLKVGDKMSGTLQDTEIRINLVSGSEVTLARDKIRSIRMRK